MNRTYRIAMIAAFFLAVMVILALRSHGAEQGAPDMNAQRADGSVQGPTTSPDGNDIYASCSLMPRNTPANAKARHDCFVEMQRRATAQKKALEAATTYTIILYTPGGEQLKYQAQQMTSSMTGVEFLDMSTQHRMRINGTFTLESSSDHIIETETDSEDED